MEYTRQRIAGLDCVIAEQNTVETDVLIVLCHGFGAPGTDLVPVAEELARSCPAVSLCSLVFPAAPNQLDPHFDSRAWWHIDIEQLQRCMELGEFREMRDSVPDRLEECTERIGQVINEMAEARQIAANKIIVGGFSQGAMLTTNVALNFPSALGGLIVWSGSLINETAWRTAAEKQQTLDVAQSHGKLDPILPFFGGEALRDILQEFGHQVEFVDFFGQHAIPPQAMDVARRLIERVVERQDNSA